MPRSGLERLSRRGQLARAIGRDARQKIKGLDWSVAWRPRESVDSGASDIHRERGGGRALWGTGALCLVSASEAGQAGSASSIARLASIATGARRAIGLQCLAAGFLIAPLNPHDLQVLPVRVGKPSGDHIGMQWHGCLRIDNAVAS